MPLTPSFRNTAASMRPLDAAHTHGLWLALYTGLKTGLKRGLTNTLLGLLGGVLFAAGVCAQGVQGQPQMQLPRVQISAGMHLIDAQVAANFEQRATGLMHRKEMPTNEGMLFVFEQPAQQCFWMKNTLLPLTAAFVADDGRIVNLVDMKPQTLDSHCSTEPVRFVLEMNQGWFAKKGLKAGNTLRSSLFKN